MSILRKSGCASNHRICSRGDAFRKCHYRIPPDRHTNITRWHGKRLIIRRARITRMISAGLAIRLTQWRIRHHRWSRMLMREKRAKKIKSKVLIKSTSIRRKEVLPASLVSCEV